MQITSGLDLKKFLSECNNLSIDLDDPNMVLSQGQAPKIDKYDPMVPDTLLRSAFLYNQMNVQMAIDVLKNLA